MIDTHAHLEQIEDLDKALENARNDGIKGIVGVSVDLESSKKILDISKVSSDPIVYAGMGMHPSEANPDDLEELVDLIKENVSRLKLIGEIGLDFFYKWVRKDDQKKKEQREVFQRLVELAKDVDLPISVHSRGKWRECFETVRDRGIKDCVFHWFSGPIDVLDDILAQGYYVSATPSIAYSEQSQEVVKHAPIEQTLIETDCPVYYRNKFGDGKDGFRSEPKDVLRTLKLYCKLKEIDEKEAALVLNENARKLFRIC
ncbi:MAG: TatD family hydrolase [Candidatus Omnitrophica bacterium]|nr:TatD family hydrolase [Candidatus Omnitrophota bacterium]MBU1995625.1 TatD family hydrolase [Candidatus Omnitrophota bacterium]